MKILAGVGYANPRPKGHGPALAPPRLVVVHKTDNTATKAQEAHYAATRTDPQRFWTSTHFWVDNTGALGGVSLDEQSWTSRAHGNAISWQVEICGPSSPTDFNAVEIGYAARLVATLCHLGNIPIIDLNATMVRNGARGICGHADITAAYPEDHGDHTDPNWNLDEWERFIAQCDASRLVDAAHPLPPLTPIGAPRYVQVAPYTRPAPWNATLSGIAAHEHTTVERLMQLNPQISHPDLIITGSKVRVA